MTDSVYKRQIPIIVVLISLIFFISIYVALEKYFEKSSHDLIYSWYQIEFVSLQQGNILSSVTKIQRTLSNSDSLKSIVVIDANGIELLNIGNKKTNLIFDYPFTQNLKSKRLGLFRYAYFFEINGLKIVFLMYSPSLLRSLLFLAGYVVALLTLLTFFIKSISAKQEQSKNFFLINEANLKLEFSQAINNLSTKVAHDIRSPLSALNIVLSRVEMNTEEFEIIQRSIDRINQIANSVLGSSALPIDFNGLNSQTNVVPVKKITKLDSLILNLIAEKRILISDKKEINIEADLEEECEVLTDVDATEIERIISNLINNSIEAFINDKGNIKLSLRASENNVFITIHDNGCGIPKEHLSSIGEKRFSIGKENGNGLGLYYAKETIKAYKGELVIDSRQDVGTMITIKLPAVNRAP